MTMLCSAWLGIARPLAINSQARFFSSGIPSSIACSLPVKSTSVASSSLDEQEQQLAQRVMDAKAAMVQLGYHGPSLWTQVICWGDHDQFQHVNNVHYLRFVESARMRFAEWGIAPKLSPERRMDMLKGTGQSYILHSVSLRYKRPVVYPDTLLIGKRPVAPLLKDRFTLETGIYSTSQGAIVATASEINVCYDYSKLSKIEMPQDFRSAIETIMGNSDSTS